MLRPSTKPMTRKKPLLPGTKRMKQGRSTTTPTKAEALRIVDSKLGPCAPCVVWARAGHMPIEHVTKGGDYHHETSGGIRRGHMAGFCNCPWHHRRVPGEGWTREQMRQHYGPSLAEGSKAFYAAFGDADSLIELQTRLNEGETP